MNLTRATLTKAGLSAQLGQKCLILPVFPPNVQYILRVARDSRDGTDNRPESIRSFLYRQVWAKSGNG